MDPQTRSASLYDGTGGGEVTKTKRRFSSPPPRTTGWISGIASGAVKIISSVFDSSSSSSESDEECDSDDDVSTSDLDGNLNGANTSNLEAERKHIIKQLLLQETFSREESDMLVKIIHSRVQKHSSVDRVEMNASSLTPERSTPNVTPEHAVTEAKKFLEEKKAERRLQSEFGIGSSGLYSSMIQHGESDAGSPAHMAKSYMQARPPWASPSRDHFELRTPSTMLTHLTSEENPHSESKKRKFIASGAWNMQEELRRVRSKATEDMLRPLSSSKDTNFSSRNDSKGAEVIETDLLPNSETQKANSIPPSPTRLSGGDTIGENQRCTIEGNVATSHEKIINNSPLHYKCELLSELNIDIPDGYDSVNVDTGSRKSYEDLSQEQSEPEGKQVVPGTSDGVNMNQQGEKTPVRRQSKRQKKAA